MIKLPSSLRLATDLRNQLLDRNLPRLHREEVGLRLKVVQLIREAKPPTSQNLEDLVQGQVSISLFFNFSQETAQTSPARVQAQKAVAALIPQTPRATRRTTKSHLKTTVSTPNHTSTKTREVLEYRKTLRASPLSRNRLTNEAQAPRNLFRVGPPPKSKSHRKLFMIMRYQASEGLTMAA